ncbi:MULTISPECIES: tRNA1(Val) (adenine(37)-N6)-methyltransferase [Nitratiruptor]|uniref:tRNA1(Val) A37 N6-methylase TrmN6 n=1 Tax=Nitratiruptor tergarcus DSM 16512 TaxID=1069081 RepID=A0A1W1WTT4_9BACT|nr:MULTISPECIES: methyltransferase [Nitratiruptor]BCD62229.1 tRNA (adenine37-N(6))-methyltransferase TrmN6 [Nitratiruptor sp. YY08-13]BCD66165.1 tRNA (adenine37-N(6))-methyltransferase TrmN6 [Nitratiruptor sp. YY08-26]SMC09646.1 tRNA1(Val) A37 N6-methylase TrmN6 [Nitratiruptor tergarcus DSM 16512]
MIIYQPPHGYCYNSDTIFLYDFITNFKISGEVLDIGTGSGILALLVARDYDAKVNAIEIQEEFVKYAKINAQANKKDITIYFGNFLHMVFEKKFDFLISNPPFYHHNVLRSHNKMIDFARYSGHLPFEKFLQKANSILKPKGGLIFCYDAKQVQELMSKLSLYKFQIEAMKFVHPHATKPASLVMIYAKKSSKSLCKIFPPLVVFNEKGEYAKHTHEIFKKVGVHSIKCSL